MTINEKEKDRKKILVVDDDSINQYFVKTLCEEEDYTVITANNGQEAIALFDSSISVIIMDYQMPIMNGIEAVKNIRKKEKTLGIKTPVCIIGLTANTEKNIINDLQTAGVNEVFEKPLKAADFQKIITLFNNR